MPQGPGGIAAVQRDPAQLVDRERGELTLRVILHHHGEEPLRVRTLTQVKQRLAEPVSSLAQHRPIARALRGALEGRARQVDLTLLIARPAALDQLRSDPEQLADRVARED